MRWIRSNRTPFVIWTRFPLENKCSFTQRSRTQSQRVCSTNSITNTHSCWRTRFVHICPIQRRKVYFVRYHFPFGFCFGAFVGAFGNFSFFHVQVVWLKVNLASNWMKFHQQLQNSFVRFSFAGELFAESNCALFEITGSERFSVIERFRFYYRISPSRHWRLAYRFSQLNIYGFYGLKW